MKPKDAFGRYGCVPRELHPAWFNVSWSARAIGIALFSLIDDFETRRIEVHGDWMDSVCKRLAIGGKERRFAKPALGALLEAGLITLDGDSIRMETRPVEVRSQRVDSAIAPQNAQSTDSDGTSKTIQPLEIVQGTNLQQASSKAKPAEEERVCAPVREEPALKPPVTAAPPASPAGRASRLIHDATSISWHPIGKWRPSLEALGRKPDAEWKIASEVLRREALKPELARSVMNPTHIADHWESHYSVGRAPGRSNHAPLAAVAPLPTSYAKVAVAE